MPKIHIEINQEIDFNIDIYDDPISQIFYQQHLQAREEDPVRAVSIIADNTKYTINYFTELVQQAQKIGAVDWTTYQIKHGVEHYKDNQIKFNDMHKDLEVVAGMNQYAGLNQQQKEIVDELHCCLHALETKSAPLDYQFQGRGVATFKYYMWTPSRLTVMPEPVKFKRQIEPGEVQLDYCYVGKEPIFCAIHNDNSLLQQTCKIIDRISLSWKLYLNSRPGKQWGPDPWPADVDSVLTEWFENNRADMDALGYTLDKVIDHCGFYTVGRIDDLSKLEYLQSTPNIQVTGYSLID